MFSSYFDNKICSLNYSKYFFYNEYLRVVGNQKIINIVLSLTAFRPKYNNNIFLLIPTVVAFLICVTQISSSNSKSYILKQTDFFMIDSVKMLTRAFIIAVWADGILFPTCIKPYRKLQTDYFP